MADGKITVELSVDSKGAASDIAKIESQLRGLPKGEATVSANVKDAQSAIEAVSAKAKGVEGGTSVIEGEDKATGVIDKVSKAAENVSGGTSVIEGEDKATGVIDKVSDKAEHVSGGTSEIKANVQGAIADIDEVSDKAEHVSGGTTVIDGNNKPALDAVVEAEEKANAGEGKITVGGQEDVGGAVSDAEEKANAGEGKITVGGQEDVGGAVSEAEGKANAGEGKITILGDPTPALDAIQEIIAAANGADVTIDLTADSGSGSGNSSGSGGGSGIGGKIAGIGGKIGGAVGGVAKNVVSGVFEAGMSYEEKLATVATLAKISNPNADMDTFGRAMMGIAADTGQDLGDVLDAAYMALSSNVSWGDDDQGTSLQNYLRSQSELAVAGRTDIATAQNATSALMNMYASTLANNPEAAARIKTIDEARIANMMVKGAYKGRFDVGTLATNMSSSMNAAASLGVAPEDIVAMYAVLTQQNISMPAADTGVYRMISSLKDNDSDAAKYMRKAMKAEGAKGINDKTTLGDLINQGYSLQQIVTAMGNWGQRQKKPMALDDMFSLAIAGRSAQALYNAKDFWAESQAYMRNDDQLVEATMGIMSGTTTFSLSRIKAQFQSYGAMLYDALAPAVHKVLGVVTGDKFRLAMARITNKISHLLTDKRVDQIIDGLVSAANDILDVISGKKSLGDVFSGWTSGLKSVFDQFMGWVRDGMVDLMNDFIDTIPKSLQEKFGIRHLETTAEKKARLEKEARMRERYGGEFYGNEGTFLLTEELTEDEAETARQAIETLDDKNVTYADFIAAISNGTAEEWMNTVAHTNTEGGSGLLDLIESGKVRVLSEEEVAEKQAEIAAMDAQDQRIQEAYGVLGRNEIYDYGSYKEIKNVGGEEFEAVKEALRYLSQHGEQGWWNAGQEEYRKGEFTADSAVYAELEGDLSTVAASSEDAAAGMDDAARGASRAGSGLATFSDNVGNAAQSLGKLQNISIPSALLGAYAVGLDRVPYDNYPALLHKGEMVLTAAEASAYRFGGSSGVGGGAFDPAGLAMAMAGLAVQMDGRTVGRLVEKSVSQEQGVRYNRQARKG